MPVLRSPGPLTPLPGAGPGTIFDFALVCLFHCVHRSLESEWCHGEEVAAPEGFRSCQGNSRSGEFQVKAGWSSVALPLFFSKRLGTGILEVGGAVLGRSRPEPNRTGASGGLDLYIVDTTAVGSPAAVLVCRWRGERAKFITDDHCIQVLNPTWHCSGLVRGIVPLNCR
jgi:hypothetical protein